MDIPKIDILVIGCGPAGMSAAINATIRKKKTIIYGGSFCSQKLNKAPHIDNYLGCYDISGEDLRRKYLNHIEKFGIEIVNEKIDSIYISKDEFNVVSKGKVLICKSIILAVGIETVGYLPNEQNLLGKGVSYCATCDGGLYKNKVVGVVGYNKKAEEELKFLEGLAKQVYYIPMYKEIGEVGSTTTIIKEKPQEIIGKEKLEGILINDEIINLEGLFLLKETIPPKDLLQGLNIDDKDIVVNRKMETNIPGVYAAGDVTGEPYQLAKAVGEGAIAGLSAAAYLEGKEKRLD
ncbi:thioredoxin reductase (NADPH) [Desulfonispora thiosulfatigenes DSM 11270]|uniref:Thioredoxin reductase (NADPH) n=1 Tax=Desulfonispora thiosulfatigenes DSM 11270 TaxID=656914 RepID=A0A1W1VIT9_DESTI|nr:NAD(P)/FAD-dependent oxidoreductase [Desulfonispora thiosulfatigenes]SMB93299.1 thioredoxin reductase (NADPH) [Desulfonispora thiosulfatigenes DSM 11270]